MIRWIERPRRGLTDTRNRRRTGVVNPTDARANPRSNPQQGDPPCPPSKLSITRRTGRAGDLPGRGRLAAERTVRARRRCLTRRRTDVPGHGREGCQRGNAARQPQRLLARLGDIAGRGRCRFRRRSLADRGRNKAANSLLAPEAGYKPFFNNPTAPTFKPGPDGGAPGLVVLLSTTPDTCRARRSKARAPTSRACSRSTGSVR